MELNDLKGKWGDCPHCKAKLKLLTSYDNDIGKLLGEIQALKKENEILWNNAKEIESKGAFHPTVLDIPSGLSEDAVKRLQNSWKANYSANKSKFKVFTTD